MESHYQITFYVPEKDCNTVKKAMFGHGAGNLGDYQECAWQTLGEGQFKPLQGSNPYLGEIDKLEKVAEYKVEMLCSKTNIKPVIRALKSSHPYEVPAYSVVELISI